MYNIDDFLLVITDSNNSTASCSSVISPSTGVFDSDNNTYDFTFTAMSSSMLNVSFNASHSLQYLIFARNAYGLSPCSNCVSTS